ncbi:MAG: tRNA 2-thiouridine(34) synthase MnmA [Dehalococcoidia bacterium]|nr:tRNA 2-thiouridine(34) synthase MnmA [Dehalococcoidia bacterium]
MDSSLAGKRVVVAMSGGVDSAVAALLLHQAGCEVLGVTLRLWTAERPDAPPSSRRCCGVEDVDDARRVCQTLGIRHYVINAEREFNTFVVDYFIREYQQGSTPHPCIACNDRIKFDFLLQRALAWDAPLIATGHYARRSVDAAGTAHLLKAVDARKDQSYVLFGLTQQQLSHILLPVGEHTKEEVRALARAHGLPVADKPDSQEICFIPQGDYRQFIAERSKLQPGLIVDAEGRVLGEHQGIERFTIGQRRGLGIPPSATYAAPLFVTAIDAQNALVVVGPEEALAQRVLRATRVNWLSGIPPAKPIHGTVKIRYKSVEAPATIVPQGDSAEVHFAEPQRAVTPGQAAVFYQGDELLGGGFIEAPRLAVKPQVGSPLGVTAAS